MDRERVARLFDLPYHLLDDSPPLAECNRCHRQTWATSEVDTEDRMTQPDGNPCGGRMVGREAA